MTDRCRFVGFGDAPNTSIKFQLLRNRDGSNPRWDGGEPAINDFPIRHSSNIVTQVPNERAPRTLTARLRFTDAADMEALDAVQGSQATLRIPWGITTRGEGVKETRADGDYLVVPGALLVSLVDQTRYRDGTAHAVATFRRSIGTSYAVAGFAVAKETGE